MKTILVQSAGGVALIGGGPLPEAMLAPALAHCEVIVAADGGADQLLAAGLMPDAVIGDLDSLGTDARARIPADRLHLIAEQVSTDFEKAARSIAAPFALGLGFLGGRLDHGFASLNALIRLETPVILIGEDELVAMLPAREVRLDLPPGTRLSLCPMRKVRGMADGLLWPIEGLEFAPDGRIGTSNATTGPVALRMEGPGMLVMVPRQTEALGPEAMLARLIAALRR